MPATVLEQYESTLYTYTVLATVKTVTVMTEVAVVTVVTVDRNKHVFKTLEPFVSAIGIIRILFSPCFDIMLDSFVHAAWLAQTN